LQNKKQDEECDDLLAALSICEWD